MEGFWNIDLGKNPGVLEFFGPDALRFLNGQITQDIRQVIGTGKVLPSCVTDVKGKLEFRIWLSEGKNPSSFFVLSRPDDTVELEARLTRYLIADEVEVKDWSGQFSAEDFGGKEMDEFTRISNGLPKWGAELKKGMLPPEAGLDVTDISYNKGCYIGQEVISRIKSAGKLNRKMTRFLFEAEGKLGLIQAEEGKICGEITSVSSSHGLGFLKRGFEDCEIFEIEGLALRKVSLEKSLSERSMV